MISETGQPEVSIIIVSYNTRDLPGDCIRSVLAEEDCRKEIFVVDNASTDGSVAYLRESFPMVFPRDELSGLPGSIASVIGASTIVRADLAKKIGGFDEDFFLYGEDQDICLRVRRRGYKVG
ncbi:MAG TPA: glycosyltransferase [Thermodesulfobacteriota bacterium]|nr:glycosyltransferase [Thermodesulfobacteriota bacterium]